MKSKALPSILQQVRYVFVTAESSITLERGSKPQNACVISEYSILDKINISRS